MKKSQDKMWAPPNKKMWTAVLSILTKNYVKIQREPIPSNFKINFSKICDLTWRSPVKSGVNSKTKDR